MVTNEAKYLVYFRNGKYHVCNETDKHLIEQTEIYKENLSFFAADKLASDLNFRPLNRKWL